MRRWILGFLRSCWTMFGGANFILNAMALVVGGCGVLLLWWAVLEPVVPVQSADIVRISPADRVVDRDQGIVLTVTRRFCLARPGWGAVTRYWVDGVEYKQPPTPPMFYPSGCYERTEVLPIPSTLPPGKYLYRSSITFCNRMRCEDTWMREIPVVIKGRFPLEPNGPAAPMDAP